MSPAATLPALQANAIYAERAAVPDNGFDRWARGLARGARWCLLRRGAGLARQAAMATPWAAAGAALDDAALQSGLRSAAQRALQLAHAVAAGAGASRAAVGAPAAPAALTGTSAAATPPTEPREGDALALALALVGEAAARSLGLRPYPCQLTGAAALLQGHLAEMATGEGKTLTAGLAAALAASAGLPVHVVTVNDYLVQRDAETLAPLYRLLGLSVGHVVAGMSLPDRRAAYACDITYCSNKELVFDYLKDRVASAAAPSRAQWALRSLGSPGAAGGATSSEGLLLRGLHMAIVDEADSVFIDEARTPLILSRQSAEAEPPEAYERALELAAALTAGQHFELRLERRELRLLDAGRAHVTQAAAGWGAVWQVAPARERFVEQALRALHLYQRDLHYLVAAGKVQIIDESTGRVLDGRSWELGLHQLIEMKEGCPLSPPTHTLARITYQSFFGRYLRLAGMTGTASEVGRELREVYGLQVVRIAPHRPLQRRVLAPRCAADTAAKWRLVAQAAAAAQARGQPVLVGTRSLQASESLSAVLTAHGLVHQLLNAREDAEEAALIARAGEAGRITVATNIAGRGTDILLAPGVAAAGGLHVILTEYHDTPRIDRQLMGRCARQGDPGSAQAIVAADDELLRHHAPRLLRRWLQAALQRGPATRTLAWLRWQAQRRTGVRDRQLRAQAQKQEKRQDDAMAFAGRIR